MRYCRNCGFEIMNTEKFCSSCGSKCEERSPSARTSKKGKYYRKNKSKLPLILVSTALIVFSIIGLISFDRSDYVVSTSDKTGASERPSNDSDGLVSIAQPKSEEATKFSAEEIRRVTNNLQNIDFASDGEWLYFNHGGLCQSPLNSEGETVRIVDRYYPWGIFCLGDKLYFNFGNEYMYLETDNLTANPICPVAESKDTCFQTDGIYYYVDYPANINAQRGVYRVSVENPEEYELIFEALPTRLWLQGEYLYIISAYGKINGVDNPYYGTWRIELDGSNPIRILENQSNYMIFSEDRIYCQDADYSLYSVALDGSDRRDYGVKFDHGLNVNDEYIFYIDKNTHYMHRMNLEGSDDRCLVSYNCSYISLFGNWLIYCSDLENEYCKINLADSIHYTIKLP